MDIINTLKSLPHEVLKLIVFKLMRDGKITFHELAEMEAQYLDEQKRNANERTQRIVAEVINLNCDTKKNRNANLKSLIHLLVDYGMENMTHEMVENNEK